MSHILTTASPVRVDEQNYKGHTISLVTVPVASEKPEDPNGESEESDDNISIFDISPTSKIWYYD